MGNRTIRVFWGKQSTGWLNFNWNNVIFPQSVVHVSACEYFAPKDSLFGVEGMQRMRGAASIWVKNVRPHGPNPGDSITGGVEFFLQVDWGEPLNVATDITVFDPPETKHLI